ncbi:MAG TPA: hypothetical protein VEG61_09165 [Candidatus Dormibacteraeota bacterium]|nr:hypothetical protein [Candidatus Dormibacteraeota bacterium]
MRSRNTAKRAEIATLHKQMDESADKRDELNTEVKNLSEEVKKLKAKRDALNARVKELKTKRNELRSQAAEKRETLSKVLQQTQQMSEQIKGSVAELYKQINSLEWYIQTNPLAPKTERSIIARISALEFDLAKHKGLRSVKDKLLQLRVEVGALRIQAQATHEELTRIAEESEKIHNAMQELVKTMIGKRKEADAAHAEFLERSQTRREAVNELRTNVERIVQLRSKIGEAKESPRLKGEKLKSKYREAANEKVRSGGKLSFEEFQALMEDLGPDTDQD